jgi:transcriptional regulator SbtR-like protein
VLAGLMLDARESSGGLVLSSFDFKMCHTAIYAAGEPLLARAQAAGAVRPDVTFSDVVRLVSGISMIRFAEPNQISRVLGVALDGLRYQADNPR